MEQTKQIEDSKVGKLTSELILALENHSKFIVSDGNGGKIEIPAFSVSGVKEAIIFELQGNEIVVTCSDRRIVTSREKLCVVEELGSGKLNQILFDEDYRLTSKPL